MINKIEFIISKKYFLWIIVILLFLLFLYPIPYTLYPVLAQSQNCGGGTEYRAQGLVTAPELIPGSKFNTSGRCVVNTQTAFNLDENLYAELKSIYYDQSKQTKETRGNLPPGDLTGNNVYLINSNLTITANLTGSGTHVIFIDGIDGDVSQTGKLTINKNIVFSDPNEGLVFITKGNVIIDKIVTQIDAVIISSGIIYTAGENCLMPSGAGEDNPLVINGSLISLDKSKPIKFCRKLANNLLPAEVINQQPKYLVILRDLMSDTYQKWSEIP